MQTVVTKKVDTNLTVYDNLSHFIHINSDIQIVLLISGRVATLNVIPHTLLL